MFRRAIRLAGCVLVGMVIVGVAESGVAPAQEKKGRQEQRLKPWTLDEAADQLRMYPRDVYLQYVVLQLGRMENLSAAAEAEFDRILGRENQFNQRARGVDLFSLFSGALAVQESLQLDTMRGPNRQGRGGQFPRPAAPAAEQPGRAVEDVPTDQEPAQRPNVPISELAGPTVQSHPWEQMLGDSKPEISPLARAVPDDFYFVQFRALDKLIDLMDSGDLWGRHLFSQSLQTARTQMSGERTKAQLAVEVHPILKPFYNTVVTEVAVTGSDLFLREGTDVTLLFRFRQPNVFKTQMDASLASAQKAHPDARRTTGEYRGVAVVKLATADRAVNVFSAYPQDDLHVRSNSETALNRVIDAIKGTDAEGRKVATLGDTAELAYIRTLLPTGAKEEDGFVYLSDPFIRRLVGPQLKLTERRRMICYNHLRMIGHAALLYRTQTGSTPRALDELTNAGYTPGEFGKDHLACPDGGTYALSADGLSAVCSHHGHAHSLTPCCELPLDEVTAAEADEYRQFLDQYNSYWRMFFDPIALRIQATPQRYRIETIILPLIDNSIYTALARAAGKNPEQLDALPVPKRNIFSLALRFDKEGLIEQSGLQEFLDQPPPTQAEAQARGNTQKSALTLKQLGLAWHNYHDVYSHFPTAVSYDEQGNKNGLSWRVHLLPYLDQAPLYNEFHLDEPWDSEHNKKLVARMPDIFRPADEKLARAGKTQFVAPVGEKCIVPDMKQDIGIRDITDGTANTIMLLETDEEHAVVWTQPDDLQVDLKNPQAGLQVYPPGGFLVVLADGSIQFIRTSIKPDRLAALLTRDGGEIVDYLQEEVLALQMPQPRRRGGTGLDGMTEEQFRQLQPGPFLTRGIGSQIAVHVCDSDPAFAFSVPRTFGMMLGNFNGRSGFGGPGFDALPFALLVSSLNSPVYVSVPVEDPKIVDEFLDRLDVLLARMARYEEGSPVPFFRVAQDYYRIPLAGNVNARAYGFELGPVKWRFFWARIGNGLYVASKPFILEDLAAIDSGEQKPSAVDATQPAAHAMVRLRPENWNQVLPGYKLGWAENNRTACLHNLGPLSSLARALGADAQADEPISAALVSLGEETYDVHFFCPDGGRYIVAPDGKSVRCSVHGSALAPQQGNAPAAKSDLGKLLNELSDATLSLTFLEDGLHAVVTIDRKQTTATVKH